LPKPNFGNIARAVTTPAQQALTSTGTSIASANRQPPPPPSRKFDSTVTDQKLAQSTSAKDDAPPDFNVAKSDAGAELTPAQKRFKAALAKEKTKTSTDFVAKATPNAGLWSDYKPDSAPSASNNISANNIEELAKVNRGLYDQYGKLTTGSSSPKLSEPIDPKVFAAKVSDADIEKTNQSVAELRLQLEKLKARGSGSSDEFNVAPRTAIEIAGSAPPLPVNEEIEVPLHKGFGNAVQLKSANDLANRGTVRIPDPTAPANVLRASASEIPGLIQATNVNGPGKYSATSFGGYSVNKVKPSELPTGSLLPQDSNDLVANDFVKKMDQREIPVLTASAQPKVFEMPLPRKVSDASLAALAERARVAAAAPQPKVTFQNPIQQTPVAMPRPSAPVIAPPALPPATNVASSVPASAFNLPATQSPRVTRNQFFENPMDAGAPLNTSAALVPRLAQAPPQDNALSIMSQPEPAATALPADIVTGDSTYAPGSVVKPQTEALWR